MGKVTIAHGYAVLVNAEDHEISERVSGEFRVAPIDPVLAVGHVAVEFIPDAGGQIVLVAAEEGRARICYRDDKDVLMASHEYVNVVEGDSVHAATRFSPCS